MAAAIDEQHSLLEEFVAEAEERLEAAEAILLSMEVEAERGQAHAEDLRTLMRVFHTLKGNAGYVGLSEVQELAHALEHLLVRCQRGEAPIDRATVAELLRGVDHLRRAIQGVRNGGNEIPKGENRQGEDAAPETDAGRAAEEAGRTRFLVVRSGAGHVALPLSRVAEVARSTAITRLPLGVRHAVGLANLRGQIVPVVDLEERVFGRPAGASAKHLVVVTWGEERVALACLAVVDVVSLPSQRATGTVFLEDGTAVTLLDLDALLGLPGDRDPASDGEHASFGTRSDS